MVGIPQDDPASKIRAQFPLMNTFDGSGCTNWHENRGIEFSMMSIDLGGSCLTGRITFVYSELK